MRMISESRLTVSFGYGYGCRHSASHGSLRCMGPMTTEAVLWVSVLPGITSMLIYLGIVFI